MEKLHYDNDDFYTLHKDLGKIMKLYENIMNETNHKLKKIDSNDDNDVYEIKRRIMRDL